MGKKQHQKDKMYLTSTEWAWLYGGRRPDQRSLDELAARIARLPFNHCCLSLQPVTTPVCTTEGYIFEKDNLTAFVAKYKCDPITGNKKFSLEKDVFALNFHKNAEGDFHCPVLMKTFSENSKIATIRTSGNVFSHEAVEELNLKTKNYRDLLSDEPFLRSDVIILQDPMNTNKINPSQFYHFKHRLRWRPSSDDEDDDQDNNTESATAAAKKRINKMDHVTRSTLQELDSKLGEGSTKSEGDQLLFQSQKTVTKERDQFNTAIFSTGRAAASLTSTVMDAHTSVDAAVISDDVYKYSQIKKKGYVTLETNLGPLNLELYCQHAPKTCENFLLLSRRGYYEGTSFHRLIKNFMIQGGDPTGTGTGGESAFGQPFKDEFNQHLSHSGRGIVSMANSGPNTNKSQFFITFRSCKHLDRKHTVFGKVVGGIETLDKLERIETDAKDRPKELLIIKKIVIYIDPFKEVEEYIASEREKKRKDDKQVKDSTREMKKFRSGVGAFIDLSTVSSEEPSQPQASNTSTTPSLPVNAVGKSTKMNKMTSGSFRNFSNW